VGDARQSLELLNSRLERHADRAFLQASQARKKEWVQLLSDSARRDGSLLTPGHLAQELGEQLADDAIVAWDSGHNTGVLARYVQAKSRQMFSGSGMMATMASSIPYAIAAALAYPGRQVVAFTGDGGAAMLLGELATVVRYGLPIKIVVMKNGTLGQIKWEQLMFLGNPEYECDLQPIDFAGVAAAMGMKGLRIDSPSRCGETLRDAFATAGPVLVEAPVDPNEPLLPPKRMPKYVANLEKALAAGTPGAAQIRAALAREPSRSQLRE
jgi:pyruvate dehydrogenase (quinone)